MVSRAISMEVCDLIKQTFSTISEPFRVAREGSEIEYCPGRTLTYWILLRSRSKDEAGLGKNGMVQRPFMSLTDPDTCKKHHVS